MRVGRRTALLGLLAIMPAMIIGSGLRGSARPAFAQHGHVLSPSSSHTVALSRAGTDVLRSLHRSDPDLTASVTRLFPAKQLHPRWTLIRINPGSLLSGRSTAPAGDNVRKGASPSVRSGLLSHLARTVPGLTQMARRAEVHVSQVGSVASLALPLSAYPSGAVLTTSNEVTVTDVDTTSDWFSTDHGSTYVSLGWQSGFAQNATWQPQGATNTIYFHYQASVFGSAQQAAAAQQDALNHLAAQFGGTTVTCPLTGCQGWTWNTTINGVSYQETYFAVTAGSVLIEVAGDIAPNQPQPVIDQFNLGLDRLVAAGYDAADVYSGLPTPTPVTGTTTPTPLPTASSTPPTATPTVPTPTPTPVTKPKVSITKLLTGYSGHPSTSVYYKQPIDIAFQYQSKGIPAGTTGHVTMNVTNHTGSLARHTWTIKSKTVGVFGVTLSGVGVGERKATATISFGSAKASRTATFDIFYPAAFGLVAKASAAPYRHTVVSRVEPDAQAQKDKVVLHFDKRSFSQEGRQSGYFETMDFAWPKKGKNASIAIADLVSIYGTTQQAQSSFNAQKSGYNALVHCGNNCHGIAAVPVITSKLGLGDSCCGAVYATVYKKTSTVEIFYSRGKVLVQAWLFWVGTLPKAVQKPAVSLQAGVAAILDQQAKQQQTY